MIVVARDHVPRDHQLGLREGVLEGVLEALGVVVALDARPVEVVAHRFAMPWPLAICPGVVGSSGEEPPQSPIARKETASVEDEKESASVGREAIISYVSYDRCHRWRSALHVGFACSSGRVVAAFPAALIATTR